METGFIQKETKENTNFQTLLANLALADANHDFGDIFSFNEYNKRFNSINFNKGLPNPPDLHLTEKGSVLEVLGLNKDTVLNSFITNTNGEQTIKIFYNKPTELHTYNAIEHIKHIKHIQHIDILIRIK